MRKNFVLPREIPSQGHVWTSAGRNNETSSRSLLLPPRFISAPRLAETLETRASLFLFFFLFHTTSRDAVL